jgi:CoA:oxalate CoA-transferase
MQEKKPLSNVNIIDLTNVLSGPFATLLLGDLGANIIKVEKPQGDDSREFGPFINKKSCYFISLNRGKRSIVLNLKEKKDKKIFTQLLSKSDVLIENYKPKTLQSLGFSWKKISKEFPRLVYAKISGFGETGPMSNLPAYDMVVQAMGGLMSITGSSKNNLSRVGTSIGDITAGLFCVSGVLSALYKREKTNKGSKIDVSMLDCQIAILENAIARYSVSGKSPEPLGTDHPSIAPFGAFKTSNGKIIIAAGNDKIFKNLCSVMSRNDIFKSRKFSDNNKRNKNIKSLRSEIEFTLKKRKSKFWIDLFRRSSIPCSTIDSIKKVMKNPQLIKRNMIQDYIESSSHNIKVSGNPIKFNGIKENKIAKKAPTLNQDRKKILEEFGIT